MAHLGLYFQNYGVWKTCLYKCLKIPVSEHPSTVNMLKSLKNCLNLHDSFIYYIFSSFSGKLSWKMSPLVIYEIFVLFVNTLTAKNKYFLCNSGNLQELVQMQLSKKQYTFSEFFAPILKSMSNFKHFEEKDDPLSWCISQVTDCEILV